MDHRTARSLRRLLPAVRESRANRGWRGPAPNAQRQKRRASWLLASSRPFPTPAHPSRVASANPFGRRPEKLLCNLWTTATSLPLCRKKSSVGTKSKCCDWGCETCCMLTGQERVTMNTFDSQNTGNRERPAPDDPEAPFYSPNPSADDTTTSSGQYTGYGK